MEAAFEADAGAIHAFLDQPFEEEDVEEPGGEWRFEIEELEADAEADPRILVALERKRDLQDAHPLTQAAREYADLTCGVLQALTLMVEARGDAVARLAVETIERHACTIRVKTWRATGSLVKCFDDVLDEDGPDEVQSDGNGCAKLVRLLIAESREAWRVLMESGRTWADGVPPAMIRRLDALDRDMAAAFPRAMAFVRAGFDDPAA